ncbi:MAG: helix-turn-helix transcriptional regulator [Gemmatimonadales bacterium]
MAGREFLGELEEMVLLAALRLRDDAYGASILRELDERAGRDVPRGSVYVAIERLASKGFITTSAGASSPKRRGRPRRMIRVTEAGLAAVRRSHEVRERLRHGTRALAP